MKSVRLASTYWTRRAVKAVLRTMVADRRRRETVPQPDTHVLLGCVLLLSLWWPSVYPLGRLGSLATLIAELRGMK